MSTNPWLDNDQLFELTGYKLAKYQIDWLKTNRVFFYQTKSGKPRVPVGAIGDRVDLRKKTKPDEPDFSKVRRVS